MSKSDTWMPLYIGDYLADTGHLTTLQHGAYLLLLMHEWRTGPLPDDDEALATIAKVDAATWRKIGPVLRRFYEVCPEGLSQKRLAKERRNATEHSEKRSAAGKKGASGRWPGNGNAGGNGTDRKSVV